VVKKLRLSGMIPGVRCVGAVRAVLLVDLVVGVCGLAIATAVGFPAGMNPQAALETVALAASIDRANVVAVERSPVLDGKTRLSTAEFAAALRAGHIDFGVWDAKSETFIIGSITPGAARR
jgi:hypothetical protein